MVDMGMGHQQSGDLMGVKGELSVGHGFFIRTLAHTAIHQDVSTGKLDQMAGTRHRLGRAAKFDFHVICSLILMMLILLYHLLQIKKMNFSGRTCGETVAPTSPSKRIFPAYSSKFVATGRLPADMGAEMYGR